jgi:hypothetical protein
MFTIRALVSVSVSLAAAFALLPAPVAARVSTSPPQKSST